MESGGRKRGRTVTDIKTILVAQKIERGMRERGW